MRWLTAIPIYNEARHINTVLQQIRRYSEHLLIINDGSTDETPALLQQQQNLAIVHHPENRGYGAAISSAFQYAIDHDFDVLVTMDCDGQHQPDRIPILLEAMTDCEMVSGSRYLQDFHQDTPAPQERKNINGIITAELNTKYNLRITDAFCGFKAYSVAALKKLEITEPGWGMPLQLWVQAAHRNWRIREIAVPRVYLDPSRTFGGILNDADKRLAYYRCVMARTERELVPMPMISAITEIQPCTEPG